jgi:hypothetical protein
MIKFIKNKTRMKTKYLPAESATSFCFTGLITRVKKEVREEYELLTKEQKKEQFPQLTEEQLVSRKIPDDAFHDMMLKSFKKFTLNEQTFNYKSFKNNLGGFRWYVLCPQCNALCLKLYLPNKHKEKEQKYLCKDCHCLKNSSSLIGATIKYKKVLRPLKKLELIKIALLKKGMDSKKAKLLLEEYDRIERELVISPEYRLWKFQRDQSSLMSGKL